MEERMARLEGVYEQINQRLNHLEAEVRALRRELLLILIPMWVTIILAILFKP